MNYENREMKIDQLVSYLTQQKINLSPAFQRGHVWKTKVRSKLLANMIRGFPIPAIFLYKEQAGAKYTYNILDGKQRIESIILFIANSRPKDLAIPKWANYFAQSIHRKDADFLIKVGDREQKFAELSEEVVRDFCEYAIPTVEIKLDENTSLDDIISLFVDINQQGVPVKRFSVVKALSKKNALFQNVFNLLAVHQRPHQDVLYHTKKNCFSYVLGKLKTVEGINDANSRIDRMWEILLELAVFSITRQHRKPVEILRGFISNTTANGSKMTSSNEANLRNTFNFLMDAFRDDPSLAISRFATDQTHLYSLITGIMFNDWLNVLGVSELRRKISGLTVVFDKLDKAKVNKVALKAMCKYIDLAKKQTTDVSKRVARAELLKEAIENV